jgi:beta-galactosidase
VDFVHKKTKDFSRYKLISIVGAIHISSELISRLSASKAKLVFGPRTGARVGNMKIPTNLPPAINLVKSKVLRVETLPPNLSLEIDPIGQANRYIETINVDSNATPYLTLKNGKVIATSEVSGAIYLGSMLDQEGLRVFYKGLFDEIQVDYLLMPVGVRRRCTDSEEFWFNYNDRTIETKNGNMKPAEAKRLPLI